MFDGNLEIFVVFPFISGCIEVFAFPNAKFDIWFFIFSHFFSYFCIFCSFLRIGFSSIQFIPIFFFKGKWVT